MLGVVGQPMEGKNPGQREDVAPEKWVSRSLAMTTGDGTPAQGRRQDSGRNALQTGKL